MKRAARGVVLAGASMTLMACYGGPDIEVVCNPTGEISSTLPAHVTAMVETETPEGMSDTGCGYAYGNSALLSFRAPAAGTYEVRVDTEQASIVSVRTTEDDDLCPFVTACGAFATTDDVGAAGAGAGGAGGAGEGGAGGDGVSDANEPVRFQLAKGELVTVVVTGKDGDTDDGPLPKFPVTLDLVQVQ